MGMTVQYSLANGDFCRSQLIKIFTSIQLTKISIYFHPTNTIFVILYINDIQTESENHFQSHFLFSTCVLLGLYNVIKLEVLINQESC